MAQVKREIEKEVLRGIGGCVGILTNRGALPSYSEQREIQMHGRQRPLT